PVFSKPTSSTFAALTMASAASTIPTKPLTSIIPSASAIEISYRNLAVDKLFGFLAGHGVERRGRRRGGGIDLRLGARHVQAPERAVRGDVDQVDVRSLLGLVRGEHGVAGGLALEDEQRLPGQ